MTARKTIFCSLSTILLGLGVTAIWMPASPAQAPAQFNEREVKGSGTAADDPKSEVYTLDFRFKDPRLIKVTVPGRGTRICWYLWYQVINRSKTPQEFYPSFELVTLDFPGNFHDEILTTVETRIKQIEDPTGYQEIKNAIEITAKPIPVSLPPDKAFPRAVTGVAIWDGASADPKAPGDKKRDLSDSQRFSIFVGGLSNGFVKVDPLAGGKTEIIRRKTLQLNFKRAGDRYNLDSRDITFEPPAEWVYRAAQLPKNLKLPGQPDAPAKDGKDEALLPDLHQYVQPVYHRGKANGS